MILESDTILPYFQPIISADTFDVYGYEVLGRICDNNHIKSLGPYLNNSLITSEEHLLVDRTIRQKAFAEYAKTDFSAKLFLNIKPNWIYRFLANPDSLPTIRMLKEYNIPTENIVIEITEESFTGELAGLAEILNAYRKAGCKIAVDDFGSNFSNFERVAFVNPDIIKVNMTIVQKSAEQEYYNELLKMISSFCQRIGADVLFEGIETKQQLYNCVQSGGRYYQGYLFSDARPAFQYIENIGDILKDVIREYKENEIISLNQRANINTVLSGVISSFIRENPLPAQISDFDNYLLKIAGILWSGCIKLFVCDRKGWQLSSNIELAPGETYQAIRRFERKINWSWRPYFLQTVIRLQQNAEGIITKPYRDIVTKERIYTYSYPLDESYLLFIDILCED